MLDDGLLLFGVGDEVGREQAAVELHAVDHLDRGLHALRLLDRHDALAAHPLHRLGHEVAEGGVVVGGDRGHLGLLLAAGHRLREAADRGHRHLEPPIEPALDVDGARAGGEVLEAVGEDRVGEQRGRGGAVAHDVGRALGRLAEHAGAEVLLRIFEVDLLDDRDAVVAYERRAPLPLDEHALALRPERHANRVGERGRAPKHPFAGLRPEKNPLVRHGGAPRGRQPCRETRVSEVKRRILRLRATGRSRSQPAPGWQPRRGMRGGPSPWVNLAAT